MPSRHPPDADALSLALFNACDARSIATVALTGSIGASAARAAFRALATDAARGRGGVVVPVSSPGFPLAWVHRPGTRPPAGVRADFAGDTHSTGCVCVGGCGDTCPCGRDAGGRVALDAGRVTTTPPPVGLVACSAACACRGINCPRALPSITARTRLARRPRNGWVLLSDAHTPAGIPVAEFGGDLVSLHAARAVLAVVDAAQEPVFVIITREVAPTRSLTITHARDAGPCGGLARFASHACGGATTSPVVVRRAGSPWPEVCLVAVKTLAPGDEVTWRYGGGGGGPACACGSGDCVGQLPREVGV